MKINLYGTYLLNIDNIQETVMCIGIDKDTDHLVFAPFYAEDEDGSPEIHVEDGVRVVNILWVNDHIQAIKPYRYDPKFRLSAELIGFTEGR